MCKTKPFSRLIQNVLVQKSSESEVYPIKIHVSKLKRTTGRIMAICSKFNVSRENPGWQESHNHNYKLILRCKYEHSPKNIIQKKKKIIMCKIFH